MMKKIILGAVVAATMIGGFATMADAKVRIYLGSPYYNQQFGPGYFYDDDYGYYQPRHHRRHRFYSVDRYSDDQYFYHQNQYFYHHKKKKHRRQNWK
jgi:hypothetical protein